MNLKSLYLVLCVAGIVLPFSQFIPWFMEYGLAPDLFLRELFSTRIGAFFGLDVIVSAVVLIVFILVDSRKYFVPMPWLPVLATLCVGVSLGLPLYLFMRERNLETHN